MKSSNIGEKIFKDIATVSFGNILYLLSNILVGFFLPVILGVTSYGYYRIYVLYVSYCGLLHYGFVDGILLKYAGKKFEEIDKSALRCYTRTFISAEFITTIITILGALLFASNEYKPILCFVGINITLTNVTLYYQYLSQAVGRYREFSLRKILSAIGQVLIIAIFYIGYQTKQEWSQNYYIYIILVQVISLGLLLWYIYTYRTITFGKRNPLSDEIKNIGSMLKVGIVMTVAYETSRLVLLIDQQFVSLLFDINTYSQYSFAYNLLSCVTAVITGKSTVMLPRLKQIKDDEVIKKFEPLMSLVAGLVCFFLLGYHPIKIIVTYLMPAYTHSIVYFQIVFPILALSSCITIVIFTFYKVLGKCERYLFACFISLVISAVLNLIVYYVFKTTISISVASIITTVIWYLISIRYLVKNYHVKWKKNFCYTLVMILIFYASSFGINNIFLQMLVYLIAYLLVTSVIFKNEIIRQFIKHKESI